MYCTDTDSTPNFDEKMNSIRLTVRNEIQKAEHWIDAIQKARQQDSKITATLQAPSSFLPST